MSVILRTLAPAQGIAVVLTLAACSVPILEQLPPGARAWIISVENESNRPAVLVVAEDGPLASRRVGSAEPPSVPPNTTMDVVFTVPPGQGWGIFVNPDPSVGPLIAASDVPEGRAGELPLTIHVGPDGSSVSVPGEPGWFGN